MLWYGIFQSSSFICYKIYVKCTFKWGVSEISEMIITNYGYDANIKV